MRETSVKHDFKIIEDNNGDYVDLNKPLDEIRQDVFLLIEKGFVKAVTDLKGVALKSYVKSKLVTPSGASDMIIEAAQKKYGSDSLTKLFVDTYLIDETNKEKYDGLSYLEKFYVFYIDELDRMMGDFAYSDFIKRCDGNNRKKLVKIINKSGYTIHNSSFLIRENGHRRPAYVDSIYQKSLLRAYKHAMSEFSGLSVSTPHQISKLEEICKPYQLVIDNITKRLSSKSMQSFYFEEGKVVYDKMLTWKENALKNNKDTLYRSVIDAIRNVKHEEKESDAKIVKEVLDRMKKAVYYMNIEDENGATHPLNLLHFLPFTPRQSLMIARQIAGCPLLSPEEKKIVEKMRVSISSTKQFDLRKTVEYGSDKTEQVLNGLRMKYKFVDGRDVDLVDPEKYTQFCEDVDEYIKKNELPTSADCVYLIGKEILRGREPLYIPKTKEDSKETELGK